MAHVSILYDPEARSALLRGMSMITATLRPTFGPISRTVAIASISPASPPEVLSDGATIAKRTVSLEYRSEHMGAMVIRDLVERVHEEAGDGATVAALLAESLMEGAVRYLAAGGDPASIRRGLATALEAVVGSLRRDARPVDSPALLRRMLDHSLADRDLSAMVAEALESVGPSGTILFKEAHRDETICEYTEGMRWNAGTFSSLLLDKETMVGRAIEPRILVTDYPLTVASQLLPTVESCLRAGYRSLVVIAPEISDAALGLLIVNKERGVFDEILAVKPPHHGTSQAEALDDIAAATGAQCIRRRFGDDLEKVTLKQLGSARQVWASRTAAGIVGGRGDRATVQQRLHAASFALENATQEDARRQARERIGNLTGISAILRIGGQTKNHRANREAMLKAAVAKGRLALQGGVVPGGGAALLQSAAVINELPLSGDEQFGASLLRTALQAPARAILLNAGLDPSAVIAQRDCRDRDYTFDVLQRRWVRARDEAIVDPVLALETALRTAVSSVSTLLATDVLVCRYGQSVRIAAQ